MEYYFTSSGTNGEISKVVQYSYVTGKVFNLGFGVQQADGSFDDIAVSNNGDMEKILATVGSTIYHFTSAYRGMFVIAKGSTKARTRLYRKMITLNYEEISADFIIFGEGEQGWEEFVKDREYSAFLVKRKEISNFDQVEIYNNNEKD